MYFLYLYKYDDKIIGYGFLNYIRIFPKAKQYIRTVLLRDASDIKLYQSYMSCKYDSLSHFGEFMSEDISYKLYLDLKKYGWKVEWGT